MDDRELLEAAARAAGIDAEVHSELGLGSEGLWLKGARTPDNNKYWNPLNDDGDAFRLAMKLRIDLGFEKTWSVCAWSQPDDGFLYEYVSNEDNERGAADECIGPAARRAIVRAAAAMAYSKTPNVGIEPPRSGRLE